MESSRARTCGLDGHMGKLILRRNPGKSRGFRGQSSLNLSFPFLSFFFLAFEGTACGITTTFGAFDHFAGPSSPATYPTALGCLFHLILRVNPAVLELCFYGKEGTRAVRVEPRDLREIYLDRSI